MSPSRARLGATFGHRSNARPGESERTTWRTSCPARGSSPTSSARRVRGAGISQLRPLLGRRCAKLPALSTSLHDHESLRDRRRTRTLYARRKSAVGHHHRVAPHWIVGVGWRISSTRSTHDDGCRRGARPSRALRLVQAEARGDGHSHRALDDHAGTVLLSTLRAGGVVGSAL
jgi:hypothetical protein